MPIFPLIFSIYCINQEKSNEEEVNMVLNIDMISQCDASCLCQWQFNQRWPQMRCKVQPLPNMSFLVGITMADAYSHQTCLQKFFHPSVNQSLFHTTQPIRSLKNKGIIIQDDPYILPFEFASLLEVESKTMHILL